MKKLLIILFILIYSAWQVQATIYYIDSTITDNNVASATPDFTTYNSTTFNTATGSASVYKTLADVNAKTFSSGDQVLFRKGQSWYGSLTIAQSGISASRITVGAFGSGANPIISGFTTVSSWTNLGGNIWESTSACSALSTLKMVVINGVNTAMGRTPNADAANGGYLTYQSHTGGTSLTSSSLTGTPNWTGAEVVIRSGRDIFNNAIIESQSTTTLNYNFTVSLEPINGFGFFIQNDARTLDQQNEWYYNPSTKKIQVYSTTEPTDVKVASIENLFNITGSYITVDGIDFTGANSYGIYNNLTKTYQIIQNCNVSFSGINGIVEKGSHLLIDNCTISNSNNTGIDFWTNGVTYATVSNTTVDKSGLLAGMGLPNNSKYSGINSAAGTNTKTIIEYCRVTNTGYKGILFRGDSSEVRNNYVDNFCSVLDDGGGIYTYRGTQIERHGLKVYNNIILNSVGAGAGTTLPSRINASGIYIDDNTANVEIYNNTVYNCGEGGIFLHNNTNINLHDNTVFNCTYALKTEVDFAPFSTGLIITGNKFICKTATQLAVYNNQWGGTYTSYTTINNNYYARPIDDNLTLRIRQGNNTTTDYNLAGWRAFFGQDANSHKSPKAITDVADLQFYYNDTKVNSVITVNQRSIDMAGTVFSGNYTLAPFTSLVLIKDATTTNYFVSTELGVASDDNDGKSTSAPWKTLSKVNAANLVAGDNVFFKRGDSWFGQLVPQSGSSSGVITYGAYGTGEKPLIHQAVSLNTTGDWTNVSGNIWRNADPTLSATELLVNCTDAASFSGLGSLNVTSPAAATKSVDATVYNSGTNSLKIECTGNGNSNDDLWLKSSTGFAVTDGKWYEFSFYAKGSVASSIGVVKCITTGWGAATTPDGGQQSIGTNWTKITYHFLATGTQASCMIWMQFGLGVTAGNSLWFDDFSFKEITNYYAGTEVVNILLNNFACGYRKWSQGTCTTQGNWWYDTTNKQIQVYSVGNPASFYSDIKSIAVGALINLNNKSYCTVDNLALKYASYGVSGQTTSNITLSSLDIGWIGGQDYNGSVRKGNGIEFWGDISNILVQNSKIWECYDAGVTNQGSGTVYTQSNITYQNNQIWNCEYSYEYFNSTAGSSTTNILFENNTCYNAGGGWGHSQRPDPSGYNLRLGNPAATHTNFVIKNNIFDTATGSVLYEWYTGYTKYAIDYNCYRQTSGNLVEIISGSTYTAAQFAAYKTATGWDTHSINADPLFISAVNKNFNLYLQSPTINMGDPTSSFDPDGTRRDMGALYFNIITQPNLLYRLSRNSTTGKYRYNPTTLKWIMR